MYEYLFMFICACDWRGCVSVYMCMLIYVCVSTRVYACECVHVQFCMKTNILMDERSISHLFSCKIEHAHTHTLTHIHTYTHVHTYID